MPKLPPPPRRPHSRSAFSVSLACTSRPLAVTTSAPTRLSQASPYARMSQPMPPPRVKPATPVLETSPPVVARACACVSWSTSAQTAPPPTSARRAAGSTRTSRIGDRSITIPPSLVEKPATLWPPPRTATGRSWARAKPTAAMTSAAPEQRTTTRRAPVLVHAVPDEAGLVVALVPRRQDLSAHALAQLLHRRLPEYRGNRVAHLRLLRGALCRGSTRSVFAPP